MKKRRAGCGSQSRSAAGLDSDRGVEADESVVSLRREREAEMDQALHREVVCQRQDRLLTTLERLLELPTTDVNTTLNQAAQLVAEVLAAEKVDAFLHNSSTDTLVAIGTNDTPMGKRQQAVGMDRLPLGKGGRLAKVFLPGVPYFTGMPNLNPRGLVGGKAGLGGRRGMGPVLEGR